MVHSTASVEKHVTLPVHRRKTNHCQLSCESEFFCPVHPWDTASAAMLPQFLSGSCQRYQDDSIVFTTWLSKTVMACGYKTPNLTQQRLHRPRYCPTTPMAKLLVHAWKTRLERKQKPPVKVHKNPAKNLETPQVLTVKYTVTVKDFSARPKLLRLRLNLGFSCQVVFNECLSAPLTHVSDVRPDFRRPG